MQESEIKVILDFYCGLLSFSIIGMIGEEVFGNRYDLSDSVVDMNSSGS